MDNKTEQFVTCEMTEVQKGLYFECVENPDSTAYNIPIAVRLPEDTDLDRFERAVVKAAEAHPALFVNICMKNGEPVMVQRDKKCTVIRKSGDTEAEKSCFIRPFDLKNEPLYRFEICTDENGSVFLYDIHHTVFDGTSNVVFLRQISDCYQGKEICGESSSFFDAASAEKETRNTEEYKEARKFFEKLLSGREFNCDLIPDKREKDSGFSRVTVYAPESLSFEKADGFAKKNGITCASLFTASFAYALSVYTGSDEACFTTVSSGRHSRDLPDTVGMYVKTLPLCADIPENGKTVDFLRNFKEIFHQAVRHECISFGDLAADFGVNTKVSFVYQGGILSGLEIDGRKIPAVLMEQDGISDALFMVSREEDSFSVSVLFSKEFYTEEYIRNICGTLFEIVSGMMTVEYLRDINLLNDSQKEFIDKFNDTDAEYDKNETVNSVFEQTVKKYANKTALVFKDKQYTYGELDRITAKVAGYILSQGCRPEEYVAALLPRNDEAVISACGIIRSGCAFQMLDSTYPVERINYMLSDSGAKLLIADRELLHLVENYEGRILFSDEMFSLPEYGELRAEIRPENAITMIYTSGTTGKPKGSILENRNLAAFFRNHAKVMGIDENSRIASYASFGFDAGIMDIITAVMSGATLYIVPDEIRLDLMDVEKFYNENAITHGFMTTQVGRMFAEITRCRTLKAFMVGGEKLVPFKVQEGFDFINGYGPCETMAHVCHQVVKDNYLLQPIGVPSSNTKLYVADKYGRLVPPGAVGELYISGTQVGRGYLGLPEKTAAAFVTNPFCADEKYRRLYKSGDIVRLLPEGSIDYVGRRDGQVKIRGFRVELTEIEEVIRRFKGVSDATVAAFDEAGGGKYIAAYVAGRDTINIGALHKFIASEKPAYMIPKVTMQIDAIPYNQNQKVNRRALPVPEVRNSSAEIKKPSTPVQKVIHALAAQVLGTNSFGVNSDLFDCGMTSIGLLKFTSLLADGLNINIGISDIRRNCTVEAIAEFAGTQKDTAGFGKRDDYPLMSSQLGVYLDSLRNEDSLIYNIPVLMKISPDIDAEKLRKSICSAIDAHSFIKASLIVDNGGNIRLVRNDGKPAKADLIECDSLPAQDELVRPFDLFGNELYRAAVYVTPEEKYLFIDVHHILSDGSSIAVLLWDINLAYGGGTPDAEQFTGFDEAVCEENLSAGERSSSEDYYESLLKDCNTDCLPAFKPESDEEESGEYLSDVSCSEEILRYCGKNRVSPNAFFNAAFAYTLAKISKKNDVTYCTVYNGRNTARLSRTFAMLVKTLPVRCSFASADSVSELVAGMQEQLLDTMANDSVPFAELCRKYRIKPDIFFNYQGDSFLFDSIGGKKAELQEISVLPAKAPVTIEVFLENGRFRIKTCYRKNCFSRETAAALAEGISSTANKFIAGDDLEKVEAAELKRTEVKPTVRRGKETVSKALVQKICKVFSSVLGVEDILADDNFFELGGTSLSAAKVTMVLMSEKIEVKYGDIFDNPTPGDLALFIQERDTEKKDADLTGAAESTTRPALQWNLPKYANEVKREPLGNVLLTGAVGFLGIHMLRELLDIETGQIYCLIRKGSYESPLIRLRTMLFYYFSNSFEDALRDRITIIDADITDDNLGSLLAEVPFDTVINCAACVKHFADGDIIERINVKGVENLIDICKKRDKKLIQISTVSVPGIHTKESYEKQVKMHENELFVIDDMDNKYGISKYHAELKMFDAIEDGLRGKVMRAGNLMGRHSDGEFQANMESNMFLSGIRGFATMGKYPISHMTDPMRFSPVDCTARAMILLAGVNDKFTAFNCDNRYGFDEMKVIDACNRNGITICPEDDEKYYAEFREKLGNEKVNNRLGGLAAYDIPDAHAVETDNLFTTNVLYRIGFSWPLVDDTYLDRAINSIMTLDYFDIGIDE